MSKNSNTWIPSAIILTGAALVFSPDGEVHRIPFYFGEWGPIVGGLLVAGGVGLSFWVERDAKKKQLGTGDD